MKTRYALLIAILTVTACKKAEAPVADPFPVKQTVAGIPLIDFDSPEARFSCLAPRNWGIQPEKYLDSHKGASFTGDGGHILILKYPETDAQYTDAQKYAETFWMIDPKGKQPEITKELIGGATVLRFHMERMPYPKRTRNEDKPDRIDYALFPIKGGFFEIQHTAPAETYMKTMPVFEAVVKSFKPQS